MSVTDYNDAADSADAQPPLATVAQPLHKAERVMMCHCTRHRHDKNRPPARV
ncbi:hypothetical protein [Phytobacter ursingii]|uniref:Uncharacterized protein n=1 Tax=Phytobacter ursingii TaxID=1972431 RepID=A0AB35RQ22_9ENTR|nr:MULTISPECIES: hypothetical protein [Enterobacteriaceae]MDV2863407.1 hypothetical protein [Phytobacter ursingii]